MKVLMVGLGGVGQRHLRNLRTILGDKAEVLAYRVRRDTAVVTPTLQLDNDRNVEQEYGVRVFGDLTQALAEKPNIAVIANPSSLHIPIALECARVGCDLFIEKPLSHTMDGVDGLLAEVQQRGLVVMVGYQLRFHPCFLRVQEVVQQKLLGNLLAVRATVGEYLPGWHKYEDYRQGYAARADLGGGVVLSQIHEFDYLSALFGKAKRIYAVGGHFSNLEVDVEDVASTLMECSVDGRPLAVQLHQDYLQRPPSRNCEVIGDQGKAVLDFPTLSVSRYDTKGELVERAQWEGFDRNQLFISEMRHFLDCVKSRKQPVTDLHDGVWSLKLALAVKQSIQTQKIVELS
ncbi:oxidoreductase [Candidatus Koribacter versatilis Ellin345]|uniref:Oxidoreductase n=1 Tax=Koribacter versatilis (strain Ellin345) TaxID=204669 RepID=Q1IMQ2_KORVE|nr:Gfo/Idh/MocA family oxidoreductase [Candidatus Koribacter versatilis]ABF41848.1 oxidoreductase [Candidatus Koribacter versatilis Ellin345]